ncbi:zinc finger protein 723-like [Pecten maximus]|uniref:zinc finger protein 723-like n=1 Tax=Pecten maximus TaxID=6579 RepID=UPI0014589C8C|nr:zinc finger protein 723-like [Pecten maximus]XP_033727698.1 zinc finger protein 723-like [Pecten maximus]
MELSHCSIYDENSRNIKTGFNGSYEPTDSIIVRTKEIYQSFESENSNQDGFSDGQSDSEEFSTGPGTDNSTHIHDQSSPSTSSSMNGTNAFDAKSISDSNGVTTERNTFVVEEKSNLKNNLVLQKNYENGIMDCDYEEDTPYKGTEAESSSGLDVDLFKSKESLISSHFLYRSENGEPSLISPCTAALTEKQDLDPTLYGPNGNLDNRCEICSKTFSQPYLLKVHFRIHSGFKPYKCELCNKGFAQSSGLRSHKLTHTGEKPYKCDICDKTFTASGSLNMHYRTHNGERPFSCEVCGRTFRYRSAMNKHMMIHTGDRPYTCEDCGKDFSRKGNLETHRRIHTNSMPYQCDVCKKKFNQMSNLRTHQVTHSLVKPYKCDLCGSEFFTKFNMQRHIVIQHIKKKRT